MTFVCNTMSEAIAIHESRNGKPRSAVDTSKAVRKLQKQIATGEIVLSRERTFLSAWRKQLADDDTAPTLSADNIEELTEQIAQIAKRIASYEHDMARMKADLAKQLAGGRPPTRNPIPLRPR